MLDVGLGQDLEQFAREMMRGAGAGRAVVQFARIGFGVGDEFGERLGGDLVRIDDHNLRRPRDQRHRDKILLDIVVEAGIERGGDGVMRCAHEEGIAVVAPRVGTNLALMNGLTRELFVQPVGRRRLGRQHTIGVDDLRATVEPYTPEHVAEICGVDADDVRAQRGSSARAAACCPRCCKGSTSRTRRRPRLWRCTICTCCAA